MPEGSPTSARIETDSLGQIEVANDSYWGAQTERSRRNFRIGEEKMPKPMIRAIALVKKAAALTNREIGLLEERLAQAIAAASEEVIASKLDAHFPLVVWQTGSGTPEQHERERSHCEPSKRIAGRDSWFKTPGTPQ